MEKDKVERFKAIIIGGSAGSLSVLLEVLPQLSQDISAAIIIVLHRKSTTDSLLVELFSSKTSVPVSEAAEKELIEPGKIYVAPADYHLLIEQDFSFSFDASEKINFSRPSIDVSFESAAEVFRESLVGILLSGANADGVVGLQAIRSFGGTTIAQRPDTAEVPYMPEQAIQQVAMDFILSPPEIADFLNGQIRI
ncbi:MAG TPA: chemotaxis protein CheB [Flavipsychrobacter sp.]|jgi:two-component system chemotaxis response regulator CheB|nr:chemotaxis protein CheB [Flavipsychrobacter sp.]